MARSCRSTKHNTEIRCFFKLQIIGYWLNTITPFFMAGGEPAKVYLLGKLSGVKKSKTLATIVPPWFFDMGSFLLMDIFVLFYFLFFLEKTMIEAVLIAAIFVGMAFTAFLFYAMFNEKRAYKIAHFMIAVFGRIDFLKKRMVAAQRKLASDVCIFSEALEKNMTFKLVVLNAIVTVFLRIFDVLRLYVVLLAFGGDTSILFVFVAFTISRLSVFVPVLPGGIGAVESGIVVGLSLGGVPVALGAAVAIVDRILIFTVLALGGTLCLSSFDLKAKELREH
ncbi:MAG: flippase-like domain-containing protein [Candidatus Aenigmarchaeota archaeon]|nr:flippase-like domain-containing protein [Candidatus Aenigmarchaeota archaeon]